MNEKTRLIADREPIKGKFYGSSLSTDVDSTDLFSPIVHDRSAEDMTEIYGTEMREQAEGDGVEIRYRRITTENVRLPKEKWYRRVRIPGVYNRTSPRSNAVHTTKYTVINFLPKNLWEQFHRFANLFFLFIALLNFVPEVEAFAKEVGYVPLLFVLSATAIKDIFEDYRRYRSDREVNSKLCRVYDRYYSSVHVATITQMSSVPQGVAQLYMYLHICVCRIDCI